MTNKLEITVASEYDVQRKLTKVNEYCPSCGAREMWEDSCDDYYVGVTFYCAKCGDCHHILSAWVDKTTITNLRAYCGG